MKEPTFRFMKEYANFKREALKREKVYSLHPEQIDKAVDLVDKTLRMGLRGLLTCDECMMNIAKINNYYMMEVWDVES